MEREPRCEGWGCRGTGCETACFMRRRFGGRGGGQGVRRGTFSRGLGHGGPCPACGNVARAVDEVGTLRHRRVDRESHVEVHRFCNLLETNLEILVEELVAEVVTEFLVECTVYFIAKFNVDNLA